jgi:beta-1,4-mannosyltransferase
VLTQRTDEPAITVQLSLSPPNGTTRYVDQVVTGAPPQVTFQFFTWRRALRGALRGGYQVFHVHWPELIVRDDRKLRAFLRRRGLSALMALLRMRRIAIVRTIHNLRPHEEGHSAEGRVLDALDRRTDLFIRLNPTTPAPNGTETVTILHGHYRDRFAGSPLPESVPGRILHFGLIRRYKGVETLLAVFRSLDRPDLQLRIVGRPSGGLREVIEREQALDSRITSSLRFVEDEVLVEEIGQAELVVLPYREMHNSGAILVALSLNRPVLVPHTPSNAALAEEVGPGWVYMYEGELQAETLTDTITAMRSRVTEDVPRLEGRDWTSLGRQSYQAYLRAMASAGARR